MGIHITNDTIVPAHNGYPYLTPRENHIRDALLIVSLFGPITGAAVILYYTRKARIHWNFPHLTVLWMLSVSIFGTILHFQAGHTSRLTFIFAVFHTQIEILITSLLLKQSAPIGLFAAWLWGFVLYTSTLLSGSMQTVFVWAALFGGGNDVFMALLLLYGQQYLYAIAFFSHLASAIVAFTNTLIFIPIVPYAALVFFSLWPFVGLTSIAILRSESIWAKESRSAYHKLFGRFRSPGTSRSGSKAPSMKHRISDKIEDVTGGRINLKPDEGEHHFNFGNEHDGDLKREDKKEGSSGSNSGNAKAKDDDASSQRGKRDKVADKIEELTHGHIDFNPEEGEGGKIIQIHTPEGETTIVHKDVKDVRDAKEPIANGGKDDDAKSTKSNGSRRRDKVADKIEVLTGGLVDLTPEEGEHIIQFTDKRETDAASTRSNGSKKSGKGKAKEEITFTERLVSKGVEHYTKGRINLHPDEGEHHINIHGDQSEPTTLEVVTKKVTKIPGDAADYVKDSIISNTVENFTKGRIILHPEDGEHHLNLSNDDWGMLQETFEEPDDDDDKVNKHHVNPTRNPLYKVKFPKTVLYQLVGISLLGSTAITIVLVLVSGSMGP
ncbi:hypothetical protein BT69DRAFT_1249248 [Atractiella rhizophila]|nr:hypothetical protein BT69DRAFT_1249248 [Atractiella rhizophila]